MTSANPLAVIDKHQHTIPVPVFDVLRELDLGPEFRLLDDNVSGWIERGADGKYKVIINSLHPPTRQRFTAAHELGHYVFHRSLLGDGVGDNRAYRAVDTKFPNANITVQHERQANTFAANLLMPRSELSREVAKEPKALADRYGVSLEAMRIRLGLPRHG